MAFAFISSNDLDTDILFESKVTFRFKSHMAKPNFSSY